MGATGSIFMATAMGVQAGNSIVQSEIQSDAIKAKSQFEVQQAEINAKMIDRQVTDAIDRGNQEAGVARRRTSAIKGAQKVALAAGGANINQGSALDLQQETEMFGEIDEATIRGNAWREAFGYETQALNVRTGARMEAIGAKNEAKQTLLTGGLEALGYSMQGAAYGADAWGGTKTKKNKKLTNTGSGGYSGPMEQFEYNSPTFGNLRR